MASSISGASAGMARITEITGMTGTSHPPGDQRCFVSVVMEVSSSKAEQGRKVQALFNFLFVSHLLLFHWPNKLYDYTETHLGRDHPAVPIQRHEEAGATQDRLPQQGSCLSFPNLRYFLNE